MMPPLIITCGRIALSAALLCATADAARSSDKIKIDVHQSDAPLEVLRHGSLMPASRLEGAQKPAVVMGMC